jgi:hypothetical protein
LTYGHGQDLTLMFPIPWEKITTMKKEKDNQKWVPIDTGPGIDNNLYNILNIQIFNPMPINRMKISSCILNIYNYKNK